MDENKTLLVVDDERYIINSIKRICRNKKYKVLAASSGKEALEILSKEPIQVILSDQMMPEMTGAELFENITECYPDVIRILLTGHTALEGITRAVNRGAVYKVLFKPWDDEHLIQTLDQAFDTFFLHEHNKRLSQELLTLNKNLESRVEEKTRALTLHITRLQIANKLFEWFPDAAMGISDELVVVEANRKAIELFLPTPLVGNKADNALPSELVALIAVCADSAENCEHRATVTINQCQNHFQCVRTLVAKDQFAYLLYGRQAHA